MPRVQPMAPRLRHPSSIIAFDLAPGVRHAAWACFPPSHCMSCSPLALHVASRSLLCQNFLFYYTNLRMCTPTDNFLVLLTFYPVPYYTILCMCTLRHLLSNVFDLTHSFSDDFVGTHALCVTLPAHPWGFGNPFCFLTCENSCLRAARRSKMA